MNEETLSWTWWEQVSIGELFGVLQQAADLRALADDSGRTLGETALESVERRERLVRRALGRMRLYLSIPAELRHLQDRWLELTFRMVQEAGSTFDIPPDPALEPVRSELVRIETMLGSHLLGDEAHPDEESRVCQRASGVAQTGPGSSGDTPDCSARP